MIANFFKFLIGFILALGILGGGSVATALYFMNRSVPPPPKPEFANDPGRRVARSKAGGAKKKRVTPAAKTVPTPSNETPAAKPLPPGAYRARVSWGQGLSMRAEPTPGAQRVGGVGFNQEVFVLEESPDKTWQKVRVANGEQEGWVKAGNTRRVEEGASQQ